MTDITWRSRRARRRVGGFAALVVAVASLGAVGTVAGPATAQESIGQHSAVTRWVEQTLESVRVANSGTFPAGRTYAMTTAAMYDAVNGVDHAERKQPREHAIVAPRRGFPARGTDRGVAVATAAHKVLSEQFPDQRGRLDAALVEDIVQSDAGLAAVIRGLAWGTFVGNRVVDARASDGTQDPEVLTSSGGVGEYHQSWDARFRNMAVFGIADAASHLDAEGPPPLNSQEYAAAVIRIATEGAPDGNADNDELAQFWRYGANSVTETGGWFLIALEVARQEGTIASLSDTARLFAWLGMSTADAVTVVATEKADHFTWRPHFAIRRANEDGNPLTDAVHEPNWVSRFGQIGTSPEWTSGQAAFAGVGATVLGHFYGTDDIGFTFNTGNGAGDRSYGSFSEAADEASFSRILQGIHFDFTLDASLDSGQGIATEVVSQRLEPLG
jgi:hypothetical protein